MCCVLEQDTLSVAYYWFNPGIPVLISAVVSLIPALPNVFEKIDHKIFCMVILLFPLIKKGCYQLQPKVCAPSTGLPLSVNLPRKKDVIRLTDHLDLTLAVGLGVKPKTKRKKLSQND